MKVRDLLSCSLLMLLSSWAWAATGFEVTFTDPANSGFNDNTQIAPIGGNSGNTLGDQRQIAFNYALEILSQTIPVSVPIQISTGFRNLGSTADVFYIAAAGPKILLYNFSGATKNDTWYVSALANQLAGQDLAENYVDVDAQFDTGIDNNLSDNVSWYYGLDGLPAHNQFDFVTVALHELIHGLGFISTLEYQEDNNTATTNFYENRADIFSHYLQQHLVNPVSLLSMNATQRASALSSAGSLQWSGSSGQFARFKFQSGVNPGHIQLYAPATYESGSSTSHVNSTLTPNDLMEPAYNGVQHDLGLGAAFLADIGWGNYTDVVVSPLLPINPVKRNTNYVVLINVVNNGVQDAPNLRLIYTLPTNTTLVSLETPQGICDNNQPIICNLGTLEKKSIITLTATLTSNSIANLTHLIEVKSDSIEANILNNEASVISRFSADNVSISCEAGDNIQSLNDQTITLNGSSNDPDASFQWTQLSGPSVSLNSNLTANPSFVTPEESGALLFELKAFNAEQHIATDTVSVLLNRTPIANAGSDQTIFLNQQATLYGIESTDDAAITTYDWQQTSGIPVTIINNGSANASINCPSEPNTFDFLLTVTDEEGETSNDQVRIDCVPDTSIRTSKSGGSLDAYCWLVSLILLWRRHYRNPFRLESPL